MVAEAGAFDGRGIATTARGSDGFVVAIVVDVIEYCAEHESSSDMIVPSTQSRLDLGR